MDNAIYRVLKLYIALIAIFRFQLTLTACPSSILLNETPTLAKPASKGRRIKTAVCTAAHLDIAVGLLQQAARNTASKDPSRSCPLLNLRYSPHRSLCCHAVLCPIAASCPSPFPLFLLLIDIISALATESSVPDHPLTFG